MGCHNDDDNDDNDDDDNDHSDPEAGEEEDEEIMKDASGYTIIRPSEGIRKMNHLSAFRTTGKNKGYRWCISYRKWILSLFNRSNAKEVE